MQVNTHNFHTQVIQEKLSHFHCTLPPSPQFPALCRCRWLLLSLYWFCHQPTALSITIITLATTTEFPFPCPTTLFLGLWPAATSCCTADHQQVTVILPPPLTATSKFSRASKSSTKATNKHESGQKTLIWSWIVVGFWNDSSYNCWLCDQNKCCYAIFIMIRGSWIMS